MNQNRQAQWTSGILPWLTLVVLPLIVFWKVLLLRGAFFILDAMILNFPLRTWAVTRMLEGRLPLWCPEIACGFPLFAEGQAGVLYLPNWPFFALLPAHHAAAYSTILHFILAGVFTYGYLRALRCRPAAALLGGLAFQWGGFLVLRALFLNMLNTMIWLPALCWLAERWLARPEKRRGSAALMILVIALVLLAGHPQAAAYTLAFWWLLFLWRVLPLMRGGWSGRRALLTVLILVPLAAIGLAAVQLLPTLELTRHSARAGGIPEALLMDGSLPPTHLIAMVFPGLFGEPADGSYRAMSDGFYWELQAWPGIIPLFLAIFAVLALRGPPVRFHAAAAGVALLLALGKYTLFGKLLVWLPLLQNFRIPARYLFIFGFSVAVLAGLGLEALLATLQQPGRQPLLRLPAMRRAIPVSLCLLLVCLAVIVAANGALLLDAEVLSGGRHLERDLLLVPALVAAFGLLLLVAHRTGRGPAMLAAGAILLTVIDLGIHGWGYNATIDPAAYEDLPRTVCLAREQIEGRGQQRVAGLVNDRNSDFRWHDGWGLSTASYRRYSSCLHMYSPAAFGLETACFDAWSPLQIRRYRELNRLPLDRLLDLAGVGLVAAPLMPEDRYTPLIEESDFTLYRNPDPLPRVQLFHRAWLRDRLPLVIDGLADPLFDPRRELLLEEVVSDTSTPGELPAEGAEEWARITGYEDCRVEVELQAAEKGWLWLGDAWYPGWEAELDVEPVRILRANATFRAVPVPAGRHTVVFRYRPASLRAGIWVSVLSALLLVPLALLLAGGGGVTLPAAVDSPASAGGKRLVIGLLAFVLLVVLVSIALRWELWATAFQGLRLPVGG